MASHSSRGSKSRPARWRRWIGFPIAALVFMSIGAERQAGGADIPPGVTEIEAPAPLEISGVAAIAGGYVVVGDDTEDHGRFWPGGGRLTVDPKVGDMESIDVGFGPGGRELWMVLGEDERRLVDLSGPGYRLPPRYDEICGRGVEGLSVRWADGLWQVAVLWEGGFYDRSSWNCDPPAVFAKPRVAILQWAPGTGFVGPLREFELDVPVPGDGERFRAPDLTWDGDDLLVLISSGREDGSQFSHTWLQRFDLSGRPVGAPFKLEERWGAYWAGKNWEALDRTLDGAGLVIGFDAKKGRRFLVTFPYP